MGGANDCQNIRVGRDSAAVPEMHCGDNDLVKHLYDELSRKVTWVQGAGHGKREVGTGFFVGNGDEIITNAHVATAESSLEVISADGNTYPAYVVKYDDIHDLALLKVVGIEPDSSRAITLASENQELPSLAFSLGYPGLNQLTVSPGDSSGQGSQLDALKKEMGAEQSDKLVADTLAGLAPVQKKDYLEQINSKEIWYSQFQLKGASGSPQLNEKGELIGVIHTGYDLAAGKKMTGTIPLSAVKSLLSDDPGQFTFNYEFKPYVIKTDEGKIQAAVAAPLKEIIRRNVSSADSRTPTFLFNLSP